jgi:histidyl-tRNA synthetase
MSQIPTAPPSGFRDFLPDACAARVKAVETISGVYRAYGFQQIATSALEDLAVLLGKGGGENEKLIFKVMKRGAQLDEAKAAVGELADMGLRFDLTLPLARYYSKYGSTLPHPFKAFNIGPVWRAERAQKGRYREFYQCDVDIIGSDSACAEIEVITAILAAFLAFDVEASVVLNDRGRLLERIKAAGVPQDKVGEACIALDKLDKIGRDGVLKELEERGLPAALLADGGAEDAALRGIIDAVNAAAGRAAASYDANLVRGFDYYTGTVFEFRHPKFSGSIGGGGRYDRLTEKFGGQPIPACGGSIGFERLMLILEQQERRAAAGPDVCVTVFSEELRGESLKAATELRRRGLSVDLFPGGGKLKAQFKYADAKKAAYAVVIGPDEAAAGRVNLKNLKTGEEKALPRAELADALVAANLAQG